MWYMCRGYDNPEIAEVLEVSTHTAKAHVAAILRKFGVKTRAAVTYIAGKNYVEMEKLVKFVLKNPERSF